MRRANNIAITKRKAILNLEIKEILAREILDSRANPTISVEVRLSDGSVGEGSVPSGASCGKYEAREKRDTESGRYYGRGVLEAIGGVNDIIFPSLVGMSPYEIEEADSVMIALDGTLNKSKLGANAILAVSIALARAAANSLGIPLYRYLGGYLVKKMPQPMMNILNGGRHADNNIEIQEFMLVPTGAESFTEGVRMVSECYHSLKNVLRSRSLSTGVGDEGGFAPNLNSDEEALELLSLAVSEAGYEIKRDISFAIDAAASEWFYEGEYYLRKRGERRTKDELISYFLDLSEKYPIISIEDPMGEDDIVGWQRMSERFSGRGVNLVGDDLFVTNTERIALGAREKIANAVLIKPNQIGSITEAHEAVSLSRELGYKTVISHRSGETEDSFISDFAVAVSADFVKMGAPARGERCAKYNRLMKIESELFAPSYGFLK